MDISVKELKELQHESQLAIINIILNNSDKHVHFCDKLDKNLLDGEKWRREIIELGDGLKEKYFS